MANENGCALVVMACVLAGVVWIIEAGIIMFCWNLLIPGLFGGPSVTFLQSFAMGVLISFIPGLFRGKK